MAQVHSQEFQENLRASLATSVETISSSFAWIIAATGRCGIKPAYVAVSLSTVPKRSAWVGQGSRK